MTFSDAATSLVSSVNRGIVAAAHSAWEMLRFPEHVAETVASGYVAVSGIRPVEKEWPTLHRLFTDPRAQWEMEVTAAETSWMNPAFWYDEPLTAFDDFVVRAGAALPQAAALAYGLAKSPSLSIPVEDVALVAARTTGSALDWLGQKLFGGPINPGGLTPQGAVMAVPVAREAVAVSATAPPVRWFGPRSGFIVLNASNDGGGGGETSPSSPYSLGEVQFARRVFQTNRGNGNFLKLFADFRKKAGNPATVTPELQCAFLAELQRFGIEVDWLTARIASEDLASLQNLQQLSPARFRWYENALTTLDGAETPLAQAYRYFLRRIKRKPEGLASFHQFVSHLDDLGVVLNDAGSAIPTTLDYALETLHGELSAVWRPRRLTGIWRMGEWKAARLRELSPNMELLMTLKEGTAGSARPRFSTVEPPSLSVVPRPHPRR